MIIMQYFFTYSNIHQHRTNKSYPDWINTKEPTTWNYLTRHSYLPFKAPLADLSRLIVTHIMLFVSSGRDTCVVMVPQTQQYSRILTHTSACGEMTQRSTSQLCSSNATSLYRCVRYRQMCSLLLQNLWANKCLSLIAGWGAGKSAQRCYSSTRGPEVPGGSHKFAGADPLQTPPHHWRDPQGTKIVS